MKYAWAVLSLGLLLVAPSIAQAQVDRSDTAVRLGRNYPNPFNPETTIPFELSESVFANGHQPIVTLKIYNVLAQMVAVPILQGPGLPLDQLKLSWNGTGRFSAYWDGKIQGTQREAPSGVYMYVLVVDGQRFSERMTVVK